SAGIGGNMKRKSNTITWRMKQEAHKKNLPKRNRNTTKNGPRHNVNETVFVFKSCSCKPKIAYNQLITNILLWRFAWQNEQKRLNLPNLSARRGLSKWMNHPLWAKRQQKSRQHQKRR